MARVTPRARDTRDKILEAALAEFAAKGFHGASIDDIAARAGATKGAVYYWFHDKEDLARDLAAALWERLKHTALEAFDPAGDTLENMQRCFDAYLEALDALPEARFFLRDSWQIPSGDAGTEERVDAYGLLRDILAAGIERGEVIAGDPVAMARLMVALYNEATLHVLETGDPGPTVELVRHFVSSLRPTRNRARAR